MKRLPTSDFRALRYILEPADFALAPQGPRPNPSDLIEPQAWTGLLALPDDVAVYSSSHCGTRLAFLHNLWEDWIGRLISNRSDPLLASAMLDAADDFNASTFNLMHGYYKQAIAALRSAVEVVLLSTLCRLVKSAPSQDIKWDPDSKWKEWSGDLRRAKCEWLCEQLKVWALSRVGNDERSGEALSVSRSVSDFYGRLSQFSHARPSSMNVALWGGSNGPVFNLDSFRMASELHIETYCEVYRLIKLARPRFRIVRIIAREIRKRAVQAQPRQ